MVAVRPIRIAFVCPYYLPHLGGVEAHVSKLAVAAIHAGYEAEVITQAHDAALPAVQVLDGVTVRRFASVVPNHNYALAPGVWTYLRRNAARFDIVHAHSYHALPALAAALAAPRVLIFTPHYHGTGHSPFRRLLHIPYRPFGATVVRRAIRVICVSEAEAALVRRHFPGSASRLLVIPNGIEVDAIRAAEPYDLEPKIILSVGRLESYKQVDLVIEAMAHLEPEVLLKVIGDGPERVALERRVDNQKLRGRVEFLGWVSDQSLYRWYRTAAVYVTCSRHEAFGMTAWEALSGGAAVVASRIPAYREIARRQDRQLVQLAPVTASARTLAEAIDALIDARGSVPAREALTWDVVAARTLNVYREVARGAV